MAWHLLRAYVTAANAYITACALAFRTADPNDRRQARALQRYAQECLQRVRLTHELAVLKTLIANTRGRDVI